MTVGRHVLQFCLPPAAASHAAAKESPVLVAPPCIACGRWHHSRDPTSFSMRFVGACGAPELVAHARNGAHAARPACGGRSLLDRRRSARNPLLARPSIGQRCASSPLKVRDQPPGSRWPAQPPACTVLQSCANTSAIDACRRAGHSSGRQRQAVAVAGPLRPTAPCNL